MSSFTQQIKDSLHQSEIQSFYEPALRVLGHLFEVKKQNLRNKGYDEKHPHPWKQPTTKKQQRGNAKFNPHCYKIESVFSHGV